MEMGANPRTKGCLSLSLELYHRNVFLTLIETEAGNYEVRLLKMFFGIMLNLTLDARICTYKERNFVYLFTVGSAVMGTLSP